MMMHGKRRGDSRENAGMYACMLYIRINLKCAVEHSKCLCGVTKVIVVDHPHVVKRVCHIVLCCDAVLVHVQRGTEVLFSEDHIEN